jgi:hypothetical protein
MRVHAHRAAGAERTGAFRGFARENPLSREAA